MIIARSFSTFKPLKESVFREEAMKAMKNLQKSVADDQERTVATWKRKPTFYSKVVVGKDSIELHFGTDNEIYGYVDKGTKPHVIRARTKKGLIFLTGGTPKTFPDVIQSFPGSRGTQWNRKMSVKHPGTKARNFSTIIAKSLRPEFAKEMKNAMERFTRRSK